MNFFLENGTPFSFNQLWDVAAGQCLQALYDHTGAVDSMMIHGNNLISSDSSGLLNVYNIEGELQVTKYYSDAEFSTDSTEPLLESFHIFMY